MRFLLSFILALTCLNAYARLANQPYSYNVYVAPPFGKVIINENITCPNQGNTTCLIKAAVNSMIKITGTKEHICLYKVDKDGTLDLNNDASYFCTGYTIPATTNNIGEIKLPNHF